MPPAVTARTTPTGKWIEDGFPTKIAFASKPAVSFWEKSVKPPGVDGGDAIEHTNMHSLAWRLKGPRKLKTLTDTSTTASYDPAVYADILTLCNAPDSITITFPNGSSISFYGFLRTFEPSDAGEGAEPTASITITPTNRDPVTGLESPPVFTAAPAGAPMLPTPAMADMPLQSSMEPYEDHNIIVQPPNEQIWKSIVPDFIRREIKRQEQQRAEMAQAQRPETQETPEVASPTTTQAPTE